MQEVSKIVQPNVSAMKQLRKRQESFEQSEAVFYSERRSPTVIFYKKKLKITKYNTSKAMNFLINKLKK